MSHGLVAKAHDWIIFSFWLRVPLRSKIFDFFFVGEGGGCRIVRTKKVQPHPPPCLPTGKMRFVSNQSTKPLTKTHFPGVKSKRQDESSHISPIRVKNLKCPSAQPLVGYSTHYYFSWSVQLTLISPPRGQKIG